ncbi:MAG: hypothetical protein CMJ78_12095 [Planctomycetaceae bacterium]|nr:hypothetical protein [Planctomycetaceae bacterium]
MGALPIKVKSTYQPRREDPPFEVLSCFDLAASILGLPESDLLMDVAAGVGTDSGNPSENP